MNPIAWRTDWAGGSRSMHLRSHQGRFRRLTEPRKERLAYLREASGVERRRARRRARSARREEE